MKKEIKWNESWKTEQLLKWKKKIDKKWFFFDKNLSKSFIAKRWGESKHISVPLILYVKAAIHTFDEMTMIGRNFQRANEILLVE